MAKGGGFKGGSKSFSKGGGGFSSSRRSFSSSRSGSSFGRNSGGSSWSWSWGSSSGRGSWTSAAGPEREPRPQEFADLPPRSDWNRDARGEGDLSGALGLAEEVSGAIGEHLDGQGHEGAARIWRWVTTAILLVVAVIVLVNLAN